MASYMVALPQLDQIVGHPIHLANGDPREAYHMCGKIRKFVDSNKITDTL